MRKKVSIVPPSEALPGRQERIAAPERHFITGAPMDDAFDGMELAQFGMGCFWGAERKFWQASGVVSTAVGYAGGHTPNPTYEEVCSGMTAHTEIVRVVFDPEKTTFDKMLQVFWENHDPTQGMRQGNDIGTQYRSAIFCYGDAQLAAARKTREAYQAKLASAGHGEITTEIEPAPTFYFAEAYHQQYLGKNPNGYCGLGGTGVACPVGINA